jgi:hypothetical protein
MASFSVIFELIFYALCYIVVRFNNLTRVF